MRLVSPRSFGPVSACSQVGLRLAEFLAWREKREGRAEGKIKEHGTPTRQFRKFLLSAHWLAGPQAALRVWVLGAVFGRNPAGLRGFDRHYGGEMNDFRQSGLGLRP